LVNIKAASNIFGNAGIGLGRVLQSSIAANINLHAVEPSKMPSVNNNADSEPNDYKDLERNGSQESTTASLNTLSAFAALGLGRGMNRFRGQNVYGFLGSDGNCDSLEISVRITFKGFIY
ncbi:hypothetical protein CEXT_657751, partial [Caerostris extrusa]